jgi:hypothetical protein
LALFRRQQRVDVLERPSERLAEPRRTLDPALAGAGGFGRVERFATHGIRKLREGSAVIHFCLRSLGLDVVEDSDERSDLLVVQIEFVCEEPERASDAEGGPALEPIGVVVMVGHEETPSALAPIVMSGAPKVLVVLQPLGTGKKGDVLEATLLASRGMTHG